MAACFELDKSKDGQFRIVVKADDGGHPPGPAAGRRASGESRGMRRQSTND